MSITTRKYECMICKQTDCEGHTLIQRQDINNVRRESCNGCGAPRYLCKCKTIASTLKYEAKQRFKAWEEYKSGK